MSEAEKENVDDDFIEVKLFERSDAGRSDAIWDIMQLDQTDAARYLIDNDIKVSHDAGNPFEGIKVYFDDSNGDEITVNTHDLNVEEVMAKGVELLKERQAAI